MWLSREVWCGFGNDAKGEVMIGTVSRQRFIAHAPVGWMDPIGYRYRWYWGGSERCDSRLLDSGLYGVVGGEIPRLVSPGDFWCWGWG